MTDKAEKIVAIIDEALAVAGEEGDAPPPDIPPADDDGGGGPPVPRARGYSDEKMNGEYALVLMGSKAVIVREQPTAGIEDRVRILSLDAFAAYFANRFTEILSAGEVKQVTFAKRWLSSRKRRTYDGIEFYPDPGHAAGQSTYLNLWRGFALAPEASAGSYTIFKDHLLTNVCGGDQALYDWVFGWFAHMMQRPRERLGTALVFKGGMGTGKTKIGEVFGSLIADHYFLVDDPRYITGQFNAHMAACLLLQAEEAVWAGDKVAEGRLKSLVTSSIQMIEAKGIDPIRVRNYVRVVMTSNENWVVPAGKDERRFAVFEIGNAVKGNHDYFREMDAELDAGGRAALLADLLAFDLASVNLREIPRTAALLEQKIRSFGHVDSWWFERLMAGQQTHQFALWRDTVPKDQLLNDYLNSSEKIGIRRRAGEVELGMSLRRLVPGLEDSRNWADIPAENGGIIRKRVRTWSFPPLAACRAAFAEIMQQDVLWPGEDDPPPAEGDDVPI